MRKQVTQKKTLSGSKGKGRVTTPLRPSGAGRAASAPPNGGRGADPNAPTTAKPGENPTRRHRPKTRAQFKRQMMSIGMCQRRHRDVNQEPLRSMLCKPHVCDRGRIGDITSMSQQVSYALLESAMKQISFLGFKRNTEMTSQEPTIALLSLREGFET